MVRMWATIKVAGVGTTLEKGAKLHTPGKLGSAHPMPQEIMPARNHFPSSPCTWRWTSRIPLDVGASRNLTIKLHGRGGDGVRSEKEGKKRNESV